MDVLGNIRSQESFPTEPIAGFDFAIEKISTAIFEQVRRAGWKLDELSGIGVGCTGPVDPKTGTVQNPYTLPTWDNCNLIDSLQKRFEIPIRLENDADAAALGEFHFGAGKGLGPMVMLTFGTGIGFSAIVDGRIYRGVDSAHPELGHMPILPDGPTCYCGILGCFESLASGTAIDLAGRLYGFPSARAVFEAASGDNEEAKAIIDRATWLRRTQFGQSCTHSYRRRSSWEAG